MSTTNPNIALYGWVAVPRDLDILLSQDSETPLHSTAKALSMTSFQIPDTALVRAVKEYVEGELNTPTFNHCMRVFYYGQAILSHSFPSWSSPSFNETYLLACLLHDISTTDKNLHSTLLSFEFHGGFLALALLTQLAAPVAQAENVAEAVIRHQDVGTSGTLTRISALLQLATLFDNLGGHPELVAKKTIEEVVAAHPRLGWSGCFAATIRRENELKPWAHTKVLGERAFPEGVEGNTLMEPYD